LILQHFSGSFLHLGHTPRGVPGTILVDLRLILSANG
jgi:hypothetical protein